MIKKLLFSCLLGLTSIISASAAPSILDIKHSITDDNIIAPESFETKAIELEGNFFLSNFSADGGTGKVTLASPEVYQKRLAALPTEIEMPYNDIIRRYIEMYLNKRSKLVSDMLALHNYYGNIFIEELEKEGVPLELQYLPVIESAINPNAVSRAGATGLWQFMPATARGLGMEINTLVDQRRDPRVSSRNAAKYLKQLYGIYGDWSLAIAAYNCGPGNVNKALRRAGGGKKDFWEIYFYLPSETRGYLPAFIAANYVMNYYDKHGIKPRVVKQPLVTDTVTVNDRIHFNQIAGVLNIPVEEIRMLNPQYRKDIIPGNNHPYSLTLPSGQILSYVMSEQEIIDFDHDLYAQRTFVEPGNNTPTAECDEPQPNTAQSENAAENCEIAKPDMGKASRITHVVAHGESLRDIARKYNVSATDIKRWNNLRRPKVKEGDELVIEIFENPNINNVAAPKSMPDLASNGGTTSATTSDVPAPTPKKPAATQPSVPAPRNRDIAEAKPEVPAPAPKKPAASNATPVPSSNKTAAAASETQSQKQKRKQEAAGSAATASKGSNSKSSAKKSAAPAKPKSVTAKKGDSLEKLAKANGTTVDAIKKANNLKGDMIREGQSLKLPATAKGSKASGSSSKGSSKGSGSKGSRKSSRKK